MKILNQAEKLIGKGKIQDAIELLIKYTRGIDLATYSEILNLASQINQIQEKENLGLGENETGRNRIVKATISILFSLREQNQLNEELSKKLIIEYPAIPRTSHFNHGGVFLRGKSNKLFSWAAKSRMSSKIELQDGTIRDFMRFGILIYNYNPKTLRVMNYSESKLKINSNILTTAIGVTSKDKSYLHYPKALEINNEVIENIKSHYFDIPAFGYMVINNSFEITNIFPSESNILELYKLTEYLEINPTNNLGDTIILRPIE